MEDETPPYFVRRDDIDEEEDYQASGPFRQRLEAIEEARRLADLDQAPYNVIDACGAPCVLVIPTRYSES